MLFNIMIVRRMNPEDLNSRTMIPIPKNSCTKLNKSDNFQIICLHSVYLRLWMY